MQVNGEHSFPSSWRNYSMWIKISYRFLSVSSKINNNWVELIIFKERGQKLQTFFLYLTVWNSKETCCRPPSISQNVTSVQSWRMSKGHGNQSIILFISCNAVRVCFLLKKVLCFLANSITGHWRVSPLFSQPLVFRSLWIVKWSLLAWVGWCYSKLKKHEIKQNSTWTDVKNVKMYKW